MPPVGTMFDLWTVHEPKADGGEYVARQWEVTIGDPMVTMEQTGHSMAAFELPLLRVMLGATARCTQRIERQGDEDPDIVETWV